MEDGHSTKIIEQSSSTADGLQMMMRCDEFQKVVQEFQKIKMSELELKKLTKGLAQVKRNDINQVRETMNGIEDQTQKMEETLPELSERLHNAQISLLPVQQAITEMVSWIEKTNTDLDKMKKENFETSGSQAVKDQLAAYKTYRIEIRVKQTTVDFINKSSTSADPFSPRRSEVDFANKLGQMNMEWEILKARIDNCISQLEPELVKWMDHENAIEKMQRWIDDHLEIHQQRCQPGSESHIQRTFLEIQNLEPKLKKKYSEIGRLEKDYRDLVANKSQTFSAESPEPGAGSSTLAKLNQTWAILEHNLHQERRNLKKALEQWERFNSAESMTTKQLDGVEHSLPRSSSGHSSMDTVAAQLAKLEELQHELQKHSIQQQLLLVESSSLVSMIDSNTGNDVRRKINSLDARWNELSASVSDLISKYKRSLKVWREYENQYQEAENRLLTVKSQLDDMMSQSMLDDPQQCELKAEELMRTCSELETSMSELSSFSEKLGELIAPNSSLHVNGQNSRLKQALSSTSHHLQSSLHQVQKEKSKIADFKENFKFLETWLIEAEAVVAQDDSSMNENVIQQYQGEMLGVEDRKAELQSLGEKLIGGDRGSRSQEVKDKLAKLNDRWKNLEIMNKTSKISRKTVNTKTPLMDDKEDMDDIITTPNGNSFPAVQNV